MTYITPKELEQMKEHTLIVELYNRWTRNLCTPEDSLLLLKYQEDLNRIHQIYKGWLHHTEYQSSMLGGSQLWLNQNS